MPPMLSKSVLIPAGIVILLAATAAPSYYFYSQYQKTQALLKNPAEAAREENRQLVSKISKIVDLPSGEDPTVATISDKEKLAAQPFFARAQNGDKVLFYGTTKKAILYRPQTNKIIEMSQVNMNETPAPPAPTTGAVNGATTTSPTPTVIAAPTNVRVAIYNGTMTPKLANAAEKSIKEKIAYVDVVSTDNAGKSDYGKTIVVDLLGTQQTNAKTLANIVGGEVGLLPSGEARPNADILIIIGKNYPGAK